MNPLAPDVTKLYDQSTSGDVAGASGRGTVDIAGLTAGEFAPELGEAAKTFAGPKSKLIARQFERAYAVQKHLKGVADRVNGDANNLMRGVAQHIDARTPDVFDATALKGRLQTQLAAYTKMSESESLPPGLSKI